MFFYNPSSRQSVWETPGELQGRADVIKMMQAAPEDPTGGKSDGNPTHISLYFVYLRLFHFGLSYILELYYLY